MQVDRAVKANREDTTTAGLRPRDVAAFERSRRLFSAQPTAVAVPTAFWGVQPTAAGVVPTVLILADSDSRSSSSSGTTNSYARP